MTETITVAYLAGWWLTSVAVYVAGRRLRADATPPERPLAMSFVAGAVWPLLLLGLVEVGALAVTEQAAHDEEPRLSVLT
ncbi:hypothetical protein E4P42_00765 [Mycobacterium sp. PS03-16]|uniref:hypothetical protein n=1 Tax=Mycobacterium sp. PS03-16 TaxID=2559611 RepID=UPI0010732817|nr:hypothetical protein [Mycobacterium sp. PS03-16]TFV61463.1 hypothetical protein E4P42_00765 [Mycobacterium sp. PS03-16]